MKGKTKYTKLMSQRSSAEELLGKSLLEEDDKSGSEGVGSISSMRESIASVLGIQLKPVLESSSKDLEKRDAAAKKRQHSEKTFTSVVESESDLEKGDQSNNFKFSSGLSTAEAERLLRVHGPNVLPEKKTPKWYIFVSQLWQPMPIMIWIACK